MIFEDKNGIVLKDGDEIDIHQTVNGQNLFIVESVNPLKIRYSYDKNNGSNEYEYDMLAMLAPCEISGEVDWEIVGNTKKIKKLWDIIQISNWNSIIQEKPLKRRNSFKNVKKKGLRFQKGC